MSSRWISCLVLVLSPALSAVAQPEAAPAAALPLSAAIGSVRGAPDREDVLDLDRCLDLALRSGNRGRVAEADEDAAVARLGQARSSRYPEVAAALTGIRFDHDPNFVFPGAMVSIPGSSMPTGIPGMSVEIPAQTFRTEDQDVTLMDRKLLTGSLTATYALYTGGLAGARIAQARAGVDAARQQRRLTDAEVAFDVKRAYYGVVLAGKLHTLARDTFDRMEATLRLTQSIYEAGTGRVRKTDWLRHRSMVESIRSMVAEFEAQDRTARMSLATLIGWDRTKAFALADADFHAPAAPAAADALLAEALAANPRLAMIQSGLAAAESEVSAAKAGHLPKIGLFAEVQRLGNSYNAGIVSPANKSTWSVGFGVDVPIFQGFRVVKAVDEARAKRVKLERQLSLAREGVELEIRQTRLAIDKAATQLAATREAAAAATESRELNVRAYQDELVETKDMIEAQLMEALLAAQHFRVQYDLAEATARLDLIRGAPSSPGNPRR